MGGKIPCADWAQIFFGKSYLRCDRVFQIWWRSVQGFSVGWGSNFAISHWLWRSSLQHSHTTVWSCDMLKYSVQLFSADCSVFKCPRLFSNKLFNLSKHCATKLWRRHVCMRLSWQCLLLGRRALRPTTSPCMYYYRSILTQVYAVSKLAVL